MRRVLVLCVAAAAGCTAADESIPVQVCGAPGLFTLNVREHVDLYPWWTGPATQGLSPAVPTLPPPDPRIYAGVLRYTVGESTSLGARLRGYELSLVRSDGTRVDIEGADAYCEVGPLEIESLTSVRIPPGGTAICFCTLRAIPDVTVPHTLRLLLTVRDDSGLDHRLEGESAVSFRPAR